MNKEEKSIWQIHTHTHIWCLYNFKMFNWTHISLLISSRPMTIWSDMIRRKTVVWWSSYYQVAAAWLGFTTKLALSQNIRFWCNKKITPKCPPIYCGNTTFFQHQVTFWFLGKNFWMSLFLNCFSPGQVPWTFMG